MKRYYVRGPFVEKSEASRHAVSDKAWLVVRAEDADALKRHHDIYRRNAEKLEEENTRLEEENERLKATRRNNPSGCVCEFAEDGSTIESYCKSHGEIVERAEKAEAENERLKDDHTLTQRALDKTLLDFTTMKHHAEKLEDENERLKAERLHFKKRAIGYLEALTVAEDAIKLALEKLSFPVGTNKIKVQLQEVLNATRSTD